MRAVLPFLIASSMVALSVQLGCGKKNAPVAAEPVATAAVDGPTLVVVLVVDQLSERWLAQVQPWFTGGLARLTGPEAYVATGRFSHALTFTCPGHATIATGAPPSVHGIPSNDWVMAGEGVYCTPNGSLANLDAEPIGSVVAEAGGKVASLSIKDRGAVLLGGPNANVASFFDRKLGGFTGPAWLTASANLAEHVAAPWTALRADDYASLYADDNAYEANKYLGTTFPHEPVGAATSPAFPFTPAAGAALTDAAIGAVRELKLGQTGTRDLLTVSYSHTDYIAHIFTAESWEALDALVRLDADLARLFAVLDADVGVGRYSVLLTADHGGAPAGALRVPVGAVAKLADVALAKAGLPTGAIFEDPSVWLPAAISADARPRAAQLVAAALSEVDGIDQAFAWRVDGVPDAHPHAAAVRQSLHETRSGDVYILLAEGALHAFPGAETTGTSHGTPYDYDARVPVLGFGPGLPVGVSATTPDIRQIAPTATALLGLRAPKQATEAPIR